MARAQRADDMLPQAHRLVGAAQHQVFFSEPSGLLLGRFGTDPGDILGLWYAVKQHKSRVPRGRNHPITARLWRQILRDHDQRINMTPQRDLIDRMPKALGAHLPHGPRDHSLTVCQIPHQNAQKRQTCGEKLPHPFQAHHHLGRAQFGLRWQGNVLHSGAKLLS